MARSSEVIRQWEVLREIDGARVGLTIAKLAASRGVHQRTIRRDIDALCSAGFPLYDDRVNGSTVWKLKTRPFRALEELGLSLIELCALYFSRTLLTTFAGAPLGDDAERAFMKIERALPVSCRRFLDRLPVMFKARIAGRRKQDDRKVREILNRAVNASLTRKRIVMRYHSHASARVREYTVEPLRISYADGGLYLTAWVPEYGEIRNFAAERIQALAATDEHFEPRPLPVEPFANSLGVHTGPAERVEVEFDAATADYVKSRDWHRSQTVETRPDGSVLMRMEVCIDRALRSWILGFGASARVVAPLPLAQQVFEQIEDARERYMPRLTFEMLRMPAPDPSVSRAQIQLPLRPVSRAS
jgi:predicted DNA-binding transcriptional regulator YafY